MTDASSSSVSPRDVRTVTYRVLRDVPCAPLAGAATIAVWPYGEVIAWVRNHGPVCKTSDIAEWEKAGMIERLA